MSDLFGNHIVGFPTRQLILCNVLGRGIQKQYPAVTTRFETLQLKKRAIKAQLNEAKGCLKDTQKCNRQISIQFCSKLNRRIVRTLFGGLADRPQRLQLFKT